MMRKALDQVTKQTYERYLSSSSASSAVAAVASASNGKSFKLPDLPYDYNALEPFISGEIMKIHHTKHHQAYITNLNLNLEKYADAQARGDVSAMISLEVSSILFFYCSYSHKGYNYDILIYLSMYRCI